MKIQLDTNLLAQAQKIYSELGLPVENAINVFLAKSVKENGFPFDVKVNPDEQASPEKANISNAEITEAIQTLVENTLPPAEIINLMDLNYTKQAFGLTFPAIKQATSNQNTDLKEVVKDENGYSRYSTKKVALRDGKYYVICTQWLDKHREPFVKWQKRFSN